MQVVNYDGNEERVAVAAICLNDGVLAKTVSLLSGQPFASKHASIVAGWCRDHFEQYSRAPGVVGLTAIHSEWIGSTGSKADGEAIAKLLESLPASLDVSVEYSVDLIARCILKANLKRTADNVLGALSQNKLESAAQLVESFQRPETKENGADGCYIFEQIDDIEEVFQETNTGSLIKFPEKLKELRDFFGPTLSRDALVAFLAPEKSGKSTMLAGLAIRAAMQGHRVAFLNLGDLSPRQYKRRIYTGIMGRPSTPCRFYLPQKIAYKDKELEIERQEVRDLGYTVEELKETIQKFQGADSRRFRLCSYPAGQLSVRDIQHKLETWIKEGWVPDVLVVDYADILSNPLGVKEKIDAINENWQSLRAISTQYHMLVLTATQATRAGYSSWLLNKADVSDSKTKTAHCTSLFGINLTDVERRHQTCRLNPIALREAEYMAENPSSVVAVAGCHQIGRPWMKSCWV